jgi:hypothetical protein
MKTTYPAYNGRLLTAEYRIDRAAGLGYLEIRDADTKRILSRPIMGRDEAQMFFANLESEPA